MVSQHAPPHTPPVGDVGRRRRDVDHHRGECDPADPPRDDRTDERDGPPDPSYRRRELTCRQDVALHGEPERRRLREIRELASEGERASDGHRGTDHRMTAGDRRPHERRPAVGVCGRQGSGMAQGERRRGRAVPRVLAQARGSRLGARATPCPRVRIDIANRPRRAATRSRRPHRSAGSDRTPRSRRTPPPARRGRRRVRSSPVCRRGCGRARRRGRAVTRSHR